MIKDISGCAVVALALFIGLTGWAGAARAFGPTGHSAVAEIAQRRLTPAATQALAELLGPNRSLASVASWADDARESRPESNAWHFVNIAIGDERYDAQRHCPLRPGGGCIVARLDRLPAELRCAATTAERREALLWAVHFVADVHQPLHTVADAKGGNDVDVVLYVRGATCTGGCRATPVMTNLHAVWDSGLLDRMAWSWGALVDRVEEGWLRSDEARRPGVDAGSALDWANESHAIARRQWSLTPDNKVLDERYFRQAMPVMERQLGLAGLRLARLLNDAYGSRACGR